MPPEVGHTPTPQDQDDLRIDAGDLHAWVVAVLCGLQVQPAHARSAARALVAADVQAIDSHGVARLPAYVERLRRGTMAVEGQPQVVADRGATALVDGRNLIGHAVAELAMDEAVARARLHGVGWVGARSSNHFGIAGYYARRAADAGLVGLCGTNAGARVAPAGAGRPFFGTNPFALAAPTARGPMLVVDMATSAVATGKLELASRAGTSVPRGWVVDAEGRDSTDPQALAYGGWMLPLGSFSHLSAHKGYALGLVIEVLSALLAGGPYGPGVGNLVFTSGDGPARVSHFFGAIDPASFGSAAGFAAAVAALTEDLRALPPTDPNQPVMTPGEQEWRSEQERRAHGIPIEPDVLDALSRTADEVAVPLPATARRW